MKVLSDARSTSTRDLGLSANSRESDYSRFFEAGRRAAMRGNRIHSAQGLEPKTKEQLTAWDAGRASTNLNTLM